MDFTLTIYLSSGKEFATPVRADDLAQAEAKARRMVGMPESKIDFGEGVLIIYKESVAAWTLTPGRSLGAI